MPKSMSIMITQASNGQLRLHKSQDWRLQLQFTITQNLERLITITIITVIDYR